MRAARGWGGASRCEGATADLATEAARPDARGQYPATGLEKQLPDCDPDEIEEAVLYWLEQIALPENVTEERMDRHEVRIERWIEAHHERVDGG